ncbi:MAG: DNA-3-methyladenine glycosylase [Acidimicrobiales bacterium]
MGDEASVLDVVARSRLGGPAVEVAPHLLGLVLVAGDRAGRIVEVEAYMGDGDPASHAFRGRTPRNATMFGPPGHLYVYFTYGMHWCANVVTGEEGDANAVLLRALSPLAGVEAMRVARPRARSDRDLCSGPAKLTQALGIHGDHDGVDLCDPRSAVRLGDDRWEPTTGPATSTRIGISHAVDHPWRWYLPGDPNLSRPAPAGHRRR